MKVFDIKKIVEDEVSKVVKDPIREPEVKRQPKYRPVLQNEEDIDDMFFYAGNTPEEVREKREKREKKSKKLLSFGK